MSHMSAVAKESREATEAKFQALDTSTVHIVLSVFEIEGKNGKVVEKLLRVMLLRGTFFLANISLLFPSKLLGKVSTQSINCLQD